MNPNVDFYFQKEKQWHDEIAKLRVILLNTGLQEELKWGCPAYTLDGNNIVLIHVFKTYCAVLFFKGALLKDPDNVLIQQTKNVQSARQMRFTGLAEITKQQVILKRYVAEAIAVEKAGLKVELKKTADYEVPEEFEQRLKAMPALKKAFQALTPGRQRAYLFYFSGAKQAKTREARIEKYIPHILAGKGIDD